MKLRSSRRALACLAAACGTVLAAQAAPAYHLVDLGPDTLAYAINSRGDVAGVAGGVAAVWRNGAWHPLAHGLGLFGIDDEGEAVGLAAIGPSRSQRAAYWPKRGAPVEIVTPYKAKTNRPVGVAAGRVVGGGTGFDGDDHCYTWTPAGGSVDLATAAGGAWCTASGINDAGQITGYAVPTGDDFVNAFIWQDGVMTFLGTIPGGTSSYGMGINRQGHVGVTGDRIASNVRSVHAALWNGSSLVELGELFDGGESQVFALNDNDDVIGLANNAAQQVFTPFLYTNGQMLDLRPLIDNADGWWLNDNSGIADDGTIVGTGTPPDLKLHGYILVPLTPLHR